MDDLRVLVFLYMVEGALVGFVGMALLGVQLTRKQVFSVGVLQGTLVYLVRGYYATNDIPFGTHTFLIMLGLVVILHLVVKKNLWITSAATLFSFVILLLSEGLMLPIVLAYMTITFEKAVADVWLHIVMGYCGNWLLILSALYFGLTKKALINIEGFDNNV